MSPNLTRRRFLRMMGVTAFATALAGCRDRSIVEVTATPTEEPPTPTPLPTPIAVTTETGIEMVLVEAGTFAMGSVGGFPRERPVHPVGITRDSYIGRYEITFAQYDPFCSDTGAPFPDDAGWGRGNRPAINVNWYDALAYCNWLSDREGLEQCYAIEGAASECDFAARGYRLPTEAEWEYAARGGARSQGTIYAGSDDPDQVAWYEGNSGGQSHLVGTKLPNELGIYDMSGNVGEWCWDWYSTDYYASSPSSDPVGPEVGRGLMGQQRVRRGGDFWNGADVLRTTARTFDLPRTRIAYGVSQFGLRVVRTA